MPGIGGLVNRPDLRPDPPSVLLADEPAPSPLPLVPVPASRGALDLAGTLAASRAGVRALLAEASAAAGDGGPVTPARLADLRLEDDAVYLAAARAFDAHHLATATSPHGLLVSLLVDLDHDLSQAADTAARIAGGLGDAPSGALDPLWEIERRRARAASEFVAGGRQWLDRAEFDLAMCVVNSLLGTLLAGADGRPRGEAGRILGTARDAVQRLRAAAHHGLVLNTLDWQARRENLWGFLQATAVRTLVRDACAALGRIESGLTRPLMDLLGDLGARAGLAECPALAEALTLVVTPLYRLRQRYLAAMAEYARGHDSAVEERRALLDQGQVRFALVNLCRLLDLVGESLDEVTATSRLPAPLLEDLRGRLTRKARAPARPIPGSDGPPGRAVPGPDGPGVPGPDGPTLVDPNQRAA